MMKEIRCISAQFSPGIEEKDLEDCLYDLYERDYRTELLRIDQMVTAMILDAE